MNDMSEKSDQQLYRWILSEPAKTLVARLNDITWKKSDLVEAWKQLVRNGKAAHVKALLGLVNPRTENEWAIAEACKLGHTGVLQVLLNAHCDPRSNDMRPLWNGVEGGHLKCVNMVLPACLPRFDHLFITGTLGRQLAKSPWHTTSAVVQHMDQELKNALLALMVLHHLQRPQDDNNFERLAQTMDLALTHTMLKNGQISAEILDVVAQLHAQKQHAQLTKELNRTSKATKAIPRKM